MDFINLIQAHRSPFLDTLFKSITLLGNEGFYLLFLPFLYWCVDKKFAARLGVLFLLSAFLNFDLKYLFQQPRPFLNQHSINLIDAEGFSMPSGHAQLSVVVWGYIVAKIDRKWVLFTVVPIVLLIGLSRIYLGVHYLHDVLVGWAIGLVTVYIFIRYEKTGEHFIKKFVWPIQLLILSIISLFLYFIYPNYHSLIVSAALMGLGSGYVLSKEFLTEHIKFNCLKFVLMATPVTIALYFGLKFLLPESGHTLYPVFRFLRYFVVGIFITFGSLWLAKQVTRES